MPRRFSAVYSGRRTMWGISAIISSWRWRSTLSLLNSLPMIGMLASPGMPVMRLGLLVFGEAAQKLHRALGHADIVRDLALADDRLVDAAQVDVAGHAGNVQVDVQGDIAVIVHARGDFHVDADIDEGELRVDQRIDADAADAGLEAAGGGGLAVADLQRGLHVVHGAQLRRLQHLGVGVAEDGLEQGARDGGGKIGGGQPAQIGQGDRIVGAGAASWWRWS